MTAPTTPTNSPEPPVIVVVPEPAPPTRDVPVSSPQESP